MILLTGATGFVGSHVVEKLLTEGRPVRVLVRRPGLFANTPVEVVRGDLITGEGVADALQGIDTVLHLAGVTKPISANDLYEGNVRATENLARAIAASNAATNHEIRTVHVSSLAAAGPGPDGVPLTEDAPPHPVSKYGESKLAGENLMRKILPGAVIVRPPAVYGPRDTDVFQVLKSIHQGLLVQVAGGERYFSMIYAGDLADGILAATRAPRAPGRTYFLTHPGILSVTQLANTAAQILRKKFRTVTVPAAAAYAAGYGAEIWSRFTGKPGIVSRDKVTEVLCRYWICDAHRAKDELGFEAATDINAGLTKTLAWYREAGWLG